MYCLGVTEYGGALGTLYIHCAQKKTPAHLFYLHDWCMDLNKNYSEYTQGKVDNNNVEISYSLRPMT